MTDGIQGGPEATLQAGDGSSSSAAAFKAIIGTRLFQSLTVVVLVLGIATEVVVLYGQSREAAIKTEIAKNAEFSPRPRPTKRPP